MDTYMVGILNPKALRLLEDLADMKLIDLKKTDLLANRLLVNQSSDEEMALARERVMRGGSQTLDVDAMVAYVNETREQPCPFVRTNETIRF